jgi:hypothetical protein
MYYNLSTYATTPTPTTPLTVSSHSTQTAPTNGPSLRSRWIDLQWHLNVLCPTLFGPGVLPNTAATNAAYGGQTPVTSYTIFSNGMIWLHL